MSKLILIGEDNTFKLNDSARSILESFGELKSVSASELITEMSEANIENIRFALVELSESFKGATKDLAKTPGTLAKLIWVATDNQTLNLPDGLGTYSRIHMDDLDQKQIVSCLFDAFEPNRSVGVKSFLKPGSTVYSESFIGLQGMGTKLDPCNALAAQNLPRKVAGSLWSTLNALIADAVTLLPSTAVDAKRVELQIGSDDALFCASIRFPFEFNNIFSLSQLLNYEESAPASQWVLAKENATLLELRAYEENKSVELIAVFVKNEITQNALHPVIVRHMHRMPLEDGAQVSQYKFKMFSAIGKTKKKGQMGFRKRHTEIDESQTVAGSPENNDQNANLVKGQESEATESNLVKGQESETSESAVVKGSAPKAEVASKVESVTDHIKEEKIVVPQTTADGREIASISDIRKIADPDKKASLYESKIQGLQEVLTQREALVKKLNKEIEEINDPLKRGAISGVIDNQQKALMQNVKRLEQEAKESDKREKELMGLVDKAIQQKDAATKQMKALETKLKQASQGNTSQTVQLQKQLEEANKQKAILAKKLAEAMDGKKKAS